MKLLFPHIRMLWNTKSSGFHQESGRFDSGGGVGVAESLLTCGDGPRVAPAGNLSHIVEQCWAQPEPKFRVLAFMAVGMKHFGVAVRKCEAILRADVDLALAHYDRHVDVFRAQPWYPRVAFSFVAPRPAIKFRLARAALLANATIRNRVYAGWSHVWISDEDADFTHIIGLHRFVASARALDAAIISPSTRNSIHSFIHPSALCQVRATDFVEVMAPLMHRCAFAETLLILHESSVSDYGIDRVWCRYFAARRRWDVCNVCAIVEVDRSAWMANGHLGGGFLKWRRGRKTALGATYNLTSALADDKCVRSKFAQYESGCLALGCRGLGDERTYCDAAKLRTTQRPQPPATCDAPGWPVFYSETSAPSQAMRAAAGDEIDPRWLGVEKGARGDKPAFLAPPKPGDKAEADASGAGTWIKALRFSSPFFGGKPGGRTPGEHAAAFAEQAKAPPAVSGAGPQFYSWPAKRSQG